jgi:hypothetical protein
METIKYFTIIRGEDRTLPMRVQLSSGGSFDLTSATEIEAKFKKQDGGALSLKLSTGGVVVTDGPAGRFTVNINDTNSALLNPNPNTAQDFEVVIDKGTDRRIVKYTRGIKVVSSDL